VASALAYLDGGTLSLVVAAIAGAAAGVGVYARSVWHWIVKRFQRTPTSQDPKVV